ncbi:methionyl-tRNA formyltransferase [candidate division KSB1 bacterium RBG_16_48_16]|nr:MAG: methionyl-tRNA formyltransferase [candidate division KSB1 bacterium RBG_16_48_16]
MKVYAQTHNIPVIQPENLRDENFIHELSGLAADLYVVVAFRILPPEVFKIPPKGTVNLHASLLPKYRGAAPINWALIHGEKKTGVTTFFIDENIDTGNILLQKETNVPPNMTAGELHDELATMGAEALLETVNRIEQGAIKPVRQQGEATKAPKLPKQFGNIHWSDPAEKIHNFIRGLSPYPGSYSFLSGVQVKIYLSEIIEKEASFMVEAGTMISPAKNGPLVVQTGKGLIAILKLQPAGKRIMSAAEFIHGYRIRGGEKFSNSPHASG